MSNVIKEFINDSRYTGRESKDSSIEREFVDHLGKQPIHKSHNQDQISGEHMSQDLQAQIEESAEMKSFLHYSDHQSGQLEIAGIDGTVQKQTGHSVDQVAVLKPAAIGQFPDSPVHRWRIRGWCK